MLHPGVGHAPSGVDNDPSKSLVMLSLGAGNAPSRVW